MKKKTHSNKGYIVALVLITGFLGFALFNFIKFRSQEETLPEKVENVPVEVAVARVITLTKSLELAGDIRPQVEVKVFPKLSGRIIRKILVERGDYVKKNDVLAILEDNMVRAQVAGAEAALDSAKASLEQVEANLKALAKDRTRFGNLFAQKALAKQRLDHIDAEYKAAEAGKRLAAAKVISARKALQQFKIQLRYHTVYAPASGYISARYVDAGAMSNVQAPIFRISSEERLKVVTAVSERYFPDVKEGMKAEIRVDAFPHKVFNGVVTIVNPTIDPSTRTADIEIHLQNPGLILRSGMFAHVTLYLGKKDALVIPRNGLNRLPGTGSYYVYVIEKNRAVMKNISTGLFQKNLVEVTAGLREGEQVATRGKNKLKDGVKVIVVPSDREQKTP